jgi:FtsH-binding integral membrane protein
MDLKVILHGGISGAQRIARHVWRMCVALFVGTGSFFLGQQKVMPAFMHGSPILLVLAFAPLVLMIFWMLRVRSTNLFSIAATAS